MPLAEPYLELGGLELANSLRTLTYLRRGLGGRLFAVGRVSPPLPEGSGYSDVYGDVYEADSYWPGNLSCYCSLLDNGPYVAPADDPAPWYDSSRPESADFLGLIAEISLPSVLGRSLFPRAGGGGTLGSQALRSRIVQVRATMVAASTAGMAWGERWLTHALTGQLSGCLDAELRLLLACPSDDVDDPASYWRTLAGVGLVDGPVFGNRDDTPNCSLQVASFQLASSTPYLLAPVAECIAEQYLRADPTACCVLEPASGIGDAASRITLRAGQVGGTVSGIEITAGPYSGSCPTGADPTISYTVDYLRRGTELVIDASNKSVTLTDTATGDAVGGLDSLDFSGLFQWMAAGQSDALCVCIDASGATLNAGTLLLVERIDREL